MERTSQQWSMLWNLLIDQLKVAFPAHCDWTKVNNDTQEKGETVENFVECLRVVMNNRIGMQSGEGWDNMFRGYVATGQYKEITKMAILHQQIIH